MIDAAAESEGRPARYDFEPIDLESGSVHADVVTLVGENVRVLELGPATGYMTRAFRERGCEVVGVEIDPGMAERATEFAERVVVGDLDSMDFDAELGDDRFDVIVAADVIEHLKDPLAAVRRLRKFLKDDGAFVISVPNIAHGSVRLALLEGRFDYRDIGLLDSTHLHFFTRESFEELLDEAELGLAVFHRHDLNLDASEVEFDPERVSAETVAELAAEPDARTYQFVAKALPMDRDGLREIQSRLRRLAELEELPDESPELITLRARNAELESTLAAIAGREGELRRALVEANDRLLRSEAEFEAARDSVSERLDRREAELAALNAEFVAARVGLERIRASAPFRAYDALKGMPGVRGLRRRRQSAFAAEVAKRTGQNS